MTEKPRVAQALVADDDPTLRLLLCQALGNWGYGVLEASDGQQAVDMAIAHQPAIVFMDLLMPVLDGYAACQAIRQSAEAAHIPIIVVTGREDIEAIEAAFQAGATDFTTKPINWPLLRHRLQFVLRASDAFREVKASEQRYALAARGANDGLWDWDLRRNHI
jgi:CheY-like chemotaxis protein